MFVVKKIHSLASTNAEMHLYRTNGQYIGRRDVLLKPIKTMVPRKMLLERSDTCNFGWILRREPTKNKGKRVPWFYPAVFAA